MKIVDAPDGPIGLYVRHADEMPVLQAMVESVGELLVVATDIHKLGKGDPWQFGTIQGLSTKRRVTLVTNRCEDWKTELKEHYASARQTRNALRAYESSTRGTDRFFTLIEVPRDKGKKPAK